MHPLFADWHRSVDLEPVPDTLDTHWGVAVELANGSDPTKAIGLAALFLGVPGDEEAREWLLTVAKEADSTFPMRDNDALVGVVAGAALVRLMGDHTVPGDAAALALVCGHVQDSGPAGRLPDVLAEAEETLTQRARSLRQFETDGVHKKRRSKPDFSDPVTGIGDLTVPAPQLNWQTAWAATQKRDKLVREAITTVNENAKGIYDSLHARLSAVEKILSGSALLVLDEETTLLWWLFGEASGDLDSQLRDLDRSTRALVVGKEVADRTQFRLGHPAARAFLDRALGPVNSDEDEIPLLDAVRSAPQGWVEQWVPENPALPLGLVPVHAASWFGSQFGAEEQARQFVQRTGLDEDLQLSALDLAEQVLHEALLIRAVA